MCCDAACVHVIVQESSESTKLFASCFLVLVENIVNLVENVKTCVTLKLNRTIKKKHTKTRR